MAGYAGGRITRINIRNFMTYDHVEIIPKKGLNLIVGLNGSGKSSIMCAICLGLAGKPQFTGRASQLSDFIKHGCKEAEIEIELESQSRKNIVICRKLNGEKCEWFLNRSMSNQNEVATAVKKFNIDTSNLCQFLPQEKVVEFSRMDKKQRLENMLQAIGEPHLFELFNELKELHKNCSEIDHNVKKCQSKKSSATEENERISDEVQKQESRVRLKKELDDLFKQKKILDYLNIYEEVQQLKMNVKKHEMELSAMNEEKKEVVAQEDTIFSSYLKQSKELEKFNFQKRELTNKITQESSLLTSFNEEVENAKIEYKNRIAEVESQKKRLHDINKQIEGLERVLTEERDKCQVYEQEENRNSQAFTQLQHDIQLLYKQIEQISAEKNQVDYSLKELSTQLASLRDEHNKKMENLKKRDKYTYQAACWLLENKHRFVSNVYLPIMLEIKVHSSENCKYIENTIPFRDMIAFVCEDRSDCELFTECIKLQNLPVNVVMAPDIPITHFVSHPLTDEYRKCGLRCFLSDLFTAPEPIMRYLCSVYNVHAIPVATSAVPASSIEFIHKKYRHFFSGNMNILGKKSRYGDRNWSVIKSFIMDKNLLTNHNDELQNDIEEKLQAKSEEMQFKTRQIEELKSHLEDKDRNQEKLRQEKKHLEDFKKKIKKLTYDYQQKKKFRSQISVVIDLNEEKVKIARKIQSVNEKRDKALVDLNTFLKEFNQLEKEIIKIILFMNSLSRNLKLTRASNEEVYDKVKAAETELQKIRKYYHEKKRVGKRVSDEIHAMGNLSPVSLNIEDIEQKINHIQAQLNLNEDNEPLVVEYNARKQKIEAIQTEIDEFQFSLDEMKEIIQEKKLEWLEPLQHHIGNINRKFSSYFKQLSCAGEISLDIPDNSDEFTSYGLQIKLKFHDDEPLTELSQTHHSGGECSVAAIVFILSLQELTEVPFRCIDEINQGMDSENERKIYQLIADSVGDDRCSQYFLLTPKLLMDLEYPDDVAVHVIFNSCFLNIKLDVKKHLQVAQSA